MFPVDHEERKRVIATKATEIIAREGLQAATIRRIAAELDFSTRAITHYFADKDELLAWVYEVMSVQGFQSFSQHLEEAPTDLIGFLLAMTSLDAPNRDLWRVYVGFWDQGMRDPHIAARLHKSIEEVEQLVADGIDVRNPGHPNSLQSARQLIALVNGISVQSLLEPDSWDMQRARATFEHYIDAILGSPAA